MQITRVCAEDLTELVEVASDAVRELADSVAVLRGEALSGEDRHTEGQRFIEEAARLSGSAQGIAERLALWSAVREVGR